MVLNLYEQLMSWAIPDLGVQPLPEDLLMSAFACIPDGLAPTLYYKLCSLGKPCLPLGILSRTGYHPLLWSVWPCVELQGPQLPTNECLWVNNTMLLHPTKSPEVAEECNVKVWSIFYIKNHDVHHIDMFPNPGYATSYIYRCFQDEDEGEALNDLGLKEEITSLPWKACKDGLQM
jgi:hypothetical protein